MKIAYKNEKLTSLDRYTVFVVRIMSFCVLLALTPAAHSFYWQCVPNGCGYRSRECHSGNLAADHNTRNALHRIRLCCLQLLSILSMYSHARSQMKAANHCYRARVSARPGFTLKPTLFDIVFINEGPRQAVVQLRAACIPVRRCLDSPCAMLSTSTGNGVGILPRIGSFVDGSKSRPGGAFDGFRFFGAIRQGAATVHGRRGILPHTLRISRHGVHNRSRTPTAPTMARTEAVLRVSSMSHGYGGCARRPGWRRVGQSGIRATGTAGTCRGMAHRLRPVALLAWTVVHTAVTRVNNTYIPLRCPRAVLPPTCAWDPVLRLLDGGLLHAVYALM